MNKKQESNITAGTKSNITKHRTSKELIADFEKTKRPYRKQEGVIYGRPVGSYEWTEEMLMQLGEELVDWFNESEENILFIDFFHKKGLYRSFIDEHKS